MLIEARLERRKIKGCNVAVAPQRAARARKRSRESAFSRCNDTLANNDGVASPGKHHLDNCLALAGGQGGRAVAHRHTFSRLWSLAGFLAQPSLSASASTTVPTIVSCEIGRAHV